MKSVDPARLQVTVNEAERCVRLLRIVVPADLVDAERQSASRKLAGRMKVKGFRKGKVPTGFVNRRFADAVQEAAMDKLVRQSAQAVIQSRGLRPISSVKIDEMEFASEGRLTFTASFEVAPEVKIGRLGGFVLPPPPGLPPLNGEVEQHVERVRQGHATWRSTDEGTPVVGDQVTVVLAHAGSRNDALGDEDADRAYDFLVGSDQALPGIQNAVQTLTVGQEEEFDVEFPGDEEGAPGEVRSIRVRLTERRMRELPELNDDLARSVGDFDTLEELRTTIRKEMEAIHRGMVERNRDEQLVRMLVEANDFDVPASFVDQVANAMIDDIVRASDGEPNAPTEADMERLRKEVRGPAEFTTKRELILGRLAEDHGLEASEEELDAEVEAIAERAGESPAEVYSRLQRAGKIDDVQRQLTARKIRDFLRQQSGLE